MTPIPGRRRQTVQQSLRMMLNNPVSRGMALIVARNLRNREETQLLRMIRDNPLVESPMLIAVTRPITV